MKKAILGIILLGALFVSCKEKSTEEKVEDAIEAIGNDIEEKTDSVVQEVEETFEDNASTSEAKE
ncbi:hypothetical protein [Flavobacterium sp.]|jgi:outer membrane lipoprotein-sorting protein|uniref:hypothetical protein n=1 Tax=Flavobacterium sp. TaxID=239 RepID=UPI002FD8A7E0